MLKRHWKFISFLERIGDNLIVVAVFFLAYGLRDPLVAAANKYALPFSTEVNPLAPIEDYFIVLGIALPLYNALLSLFGAYRSMRFSSYWRLARMMAASSIIVFLCQGSVLYLLKLDLSRSFVATFCALSAVALLIERFFVLSLLRYFRVRGKNFRNLLIVGTGQQARRVYIEIAQQPELGVRVVGFVDARGTATRKKRINSEDEVDDSSEVYDLPARVIAGVSTYEDTLKKYAVDEVLFTDVHHSLDEMEVMAAIAVEEGVSVTLAADFFSFKIFKSDISYFGSIPLIHYQPLPVSSAGLMLKRVIDIGASSALLVVLSPVLLALGLGVKLSGPGPVFFRQKRVGLNGRTFTLFKYRSMVEDAEEMQESLADKNEMTGPVFKIKDDPRVTPFGKFIRRYSLDELPQLWNVLKGEMSLVGPRPPIPKEVSMYVRKHRRRLSMRPGITCTWQVSGRNEIPDFEEWAKLDLEYVDNWTLGKDFKLLLQTIPAVLSARGAR